VGVVMRVLLSLCGGGERGGWEVGGGGGGGGGAGKKDCPPISNDKEAGGEIKYLICWRGEILVFVVL